MLRFYMIVLPLWFCQVVARGPSANYSLTCVNEGRFAMEGVCGGYVECVMGTGRTDAHPHTPTLTLQLYQCPRRRYYEGYGGCVKDEQCGSEKTTTGTKRYRDEAEIEDGSPFPERAPEHDWRCRKGVKFACGSCMQVVVCAGGEAFLHPCPHTTYCTPHHPAFEGGVCHPHWSQEVQEACSCTGSGTTLPDPYNPGAYLHCQSPNLPPTLLFCPEGHQFDPEESKCIAVPSTSKCVATGVFAIPGECRWHYTCLQDGEGWIQVRSLCPGSLMYSRDLRSCADPLQLPKTDPCSQREKNKVTRYICTFWQFMWVLIFPQKVSSVCTPS